MRVLIATHHRAVVGGVETYLRAVLPLLRAAGHEVGLLTEAPAPPGAAVVAPVPDGPVWAVGPGVLKAVVDWRPDVVYSQGLADVELESDLARHYPAVLFAHNYHGTCVSGTKCHGYPARVPCTRRLGPGCLAYYFPRRCGGRNPLTMVSLYREQTRRRRSLADFRGVLVASAAMAEEYRRHGVPADRLRVAPLFPPGVTPAPDPPAPRPWSYNVLFAGRLTKLKGCDHLIDALPLASAELGRPLTLAVAGDGPERPRLEALAERRGVEAVFHGWLGPAAREAVTREADLLAVPSVWPEPFGLVGIEAGCVGTPAVGYAVGGVPDWLTPGVTGESAPGEHPRPAELAAAVVRALADTDHWQRLRAGAWEGAKRFTPAAHMNVLEPALARAAGGSTPC